MTLFYCTTEQVLVSIICVNFCRSFAPFGTKNTRNTHFSAYYYYVFWHIELKFCIYLSYNELQIKYECHQFSKNFVGVMPFSELRILEIHSFPHFSPTHFLTYSVEILHMTLFSFFFKFWPRISFTSTLFRKC